MTDLHDYYPSPDLDAYLAAELDAPTVETELLQEGLNVNVAISTSTADSAYVLRRPNKLREAEYMIDFGDEYEVMKHLHDTPVPTPEPVLFCEDESLLGKPFFVMEHVDGDVVPLGSYLPERYRNEEARERFAFGLVDTLAEVHSVDPEPFESVCKRVTPLEQVERTAARLDEATSVTGRELPTLRSVGDWLVANAPTDPDTTLVHGDFRPGNVVFAESERPEIAGVLDWETAMLGDPLTELGYLLLRWRDEGDPTPALDDLESRYPDHEDAIADLREINETGLAPFTAEPGSPSRRDLVARYESRTGRTFEHERFYRTLAAFGLATVWEDLHRQRVEAGEAYAWKPAVEYVATLAERITTGEFGL